MTAAAECWVSNAMNPNQSPRDVVAQFFRDQTAEDLRLVAQALHQMIETDQDDETLSTRLFREFGSYFDPRGVGESTRTWLTNLAHDFDREIANRG